MRKLKVALSGQKKGSVNLNRGMEIIEAEKQKEKRLEKSEQSKVLRSQGSP